MSRNWQESLERWTAAGLVDPAAAARIRAWEAEHGGEERKSRLALIAFAFGALLLTAGVLLFVAAHWDRLAPGGRFALVLAMIAVLHAGGAFAARSSAGSVRDVARRRHCGARRRHLPVGTDLSHGGALAGRADALVVRRGRRRVAVAAVAAGAVARGAGAGLAVGRVDRGATAIRGLARHDAGCGRGVPARLRLPRGCAGGIEGDAGAARSPGSARSR